MATPNEPNIEQIQKEVTAIAANFTASFTNLKEAGDALKRDVEAVRAIAEGKGADNSTLARGLADVGAKHAALELALRAIEEKQDLISVALQRPGPTGSMGATTDAEVKAATAFTMSVLSRRGSIPAEPIIVDPAALEAYKAYKQNFPAVLRKDDRMGMSDAQRKALMVGSDPDGGYLVPTEIAAEILTNVIETSPLGGLANTITIGTDTLEFPVDEGRATGGWVGELQSRPVTSTPQVGRQVITVHEIYAKPQVTQKFLEDGAIDVEGWLKQKVSDEFALIEATALITGDGNAKPRGILTYPHGLNRGQIEQINSGNASQITADCLVTMPFMIKSAYAAGASWMFKRSTLASIALLKDQENRYLWQASLAEGRPSTLCGYPLNTADDVPAVQAGALAGLFGNFRKGYTVVRRLGVSVLRDPYSAKPLVEFYTRARMGGDVTTFEAIKILKISS